MKKTLQTAVIVLLLLVPVAIIYQTAHKLRQPRSGSYSSLPVPKELRADPASFGEPGKGKAAKDGAGPVDKAQKAGKGKKQPVALAELPAAVKAALEQEAGQAEIAKLEKETKDGQDLFTAKWGPKESERELKLAADGALLEGKAVVAFETLPEAVRTAVQQTQPSARNWECKQLSIRAEGALTVVYEVRGQADGEKLPPLRVSAGGEVTVGKGGKAK